MGMFGGEACDTPGRARRLSPRRGLGSCRSDAQVVLRSILARGGPRCFIWASVTASQLRGRTTTTRTGLRNQRPCFAWRGLILSARSVIVNPVGGSLARRARRLPMLAGAPGQILDPAPPPNNSRTIPALVQIARPRSCAVCAENLTSFLAFLNRLTDARC
jgi:hypothetical protein